MHNEDVRYFWQQLHTPYGSHCVISTNVDSQIASKCQILGTLSGRERGWCATIRNIHCWWSVPHLHWVYNDFLRRFAHIFPRHLMVHTVSFLPRLILKLHIKCRMLGTLFSQTTGWCAARKSIHCCWSILNLPNLYVAYDRSFWQCLKALMVVHTVSFLMRLTLKLYTKYQILGTLFVSERGWCAARRDLSMAVEVFHNLP